jgi:hypothetical protein
MTAPDVCTALSCVHDQPGHAYCPQCSHAVYNGATADGRYRWEFNPRQGPLFSNSRGRFVTAPRRALWYEFEAWHRARFPKVAPPLDSGAGAVYPVMLRCTCPGCGRTDNTGLADEVRDRIVHCGYCGTTFDVPASRPRWENRAGA